MAAPDAIATDPWAPRRRRAEQLRERYAFADEVLTLYLALLGVWEEAWDAARERPPRASEAAGWAADRVLPRVVEATVKAGPEPLGRAAEVVAGDGGARAWLAGWLAGEELEPATRYLARACLRVPLQVAGAGAACAEDPSPRGGRRCPDCGAPPQLSFHDHSDDALVSGHRRLACSRCAASWSYTASACASCGEAAGGRRTIYAERRPSVVVGRDDATPGQGEDAPLFPHLRIEGCARCDRYLIDVDLGRDGRAVPEVDELAALPLDLFATEQGLTKITPNLMGL
jgi:Protein involved in formate dehydrogenase formation